MHHIKTHSEIETLEEIHKGRSISRFGDGEFKLAGNRPCVSQEKCPRLADELRCILLDGSDDKCMVAIPPIDRMDLIAEGKERIFWTGQQRVIKKFANPKAVYYSSFITRSSNMPYIDTPEFWNRIVDIWRDQDVVLVHGSERSLCERNMTEAKSVKYIKCLYRDAYRNIDDLQKQIEDLGIKKVLLCAGATATVLAWRLKDSFHVIDLGHVGLKSMFKKGRGIDK